MPYDEYLELHRGVLSYPDAKRVMRSDEVPGCLVAQFARLPSSRNMLMLLIREAYARAFLTLPSYHRKVIAQDGAF